MRIIIFFLFIIGLTQTVSINAQTFAVSDVIISDSTVSLTDPEIDWYGHHICWANPQGVWIADIDSVTGNIFPNNGQGVLVDATPSFQGMQIVVNGPEWAMSQEGSEIIYPDSVNTGSGFSIGRVKKVGNQWVQSAVPNGLNRIPYFASFDKDYPNGAVTSGGINPSTMTGTGQIIRFINNSGSEVNLGQGSKGGRWIKGAEGIAYYKKVGGIDYAGYYLMSEGTTVQVTSNAYDKEQVWMFRSPEYNNELILTCIEKKSTFDELAIYRSVNSIWQKVDSLQSPSNRKGIYSPEPFWWNNKTYFFFIAERMPTDPINYYDEVWIMAIDPQNPFSRMVSNSFSANRTDPEVYYTTTEPIIYYTENRNGITIMHKCSTGLSSLTSGIDVLNSYKNSISIYPNPTNTTLFIKTENENLIQYQITNSIGQIISQDKLNGNKIDVSALAKGIYFIEVTFNNTIYSQKIIIK